MDPITNSTTSLEDATYFTLEQMGGISVLCNAARFMATVRDILSPDTIEARVFLRNCDDELLAPFAKLANGPVSEGELQLAAAKVSHILYQDRMIDGGLSDSVSMQLMRGIARYLRMPTENSSVQHGDTSDVDVQDSRVDNQTQYVPETSPHDQNADEIKDNGTTSKSKKGIIIAIAAAAVLLVIVLVVAISGKTMTAPKMSVSFSPGASGAVGVVETMLVSAGETVALPENKFEWSGHTFAGWSVDPYASELVVVQPGTEVKVEGPLVYQAVWQTTVVFDGNGADKGETKDVIADQSGKFVYPECGYAREGYMFAGWSDTADSDSGFYRPGEEGMAHGENKIYAAWTPTAVITDVSITQKNGTTTKEINGWRTGDYYVMVRVKNDTDAVLRIDTKIELLNDAGSVVSQDVDNVDVLAPGEIVILQGYKYDKGEKKGIIYLNCAPGWDFYKPIVGSYKVEKESADSTHMVARVTNTSSEKMVVQRVSLIGKDAGGNEFCVVERTWVELDPGKATDVVFDDSKLSSYGMHVSWDKVDTEFYVGGYIDNL